MARARSLAADVADALGEEVTEELEMTVQDEAQKSSNGRSNRTRRPAAKRPSRGNLDAQKRTLLDVVSTRIPDVDKRFYAWAAGVEWVWTGEAAVVLEDLRARVRADDTLDSKTRAEVAWGLRKHALRERGDEYLMPGTKKALEERAAKHGITLQEVLASYGPAAGEPQADEPQTDANARRRYERVRSR